MLLDIMSLTSTFCSTALLPTVTAAISTFCSTSRFFAVSASTSCFFSYLDLDNVSPTTLSNCQFVRICSQKCYFCDALKHVVRIAQLRLNDYSDDSRVTRIVSQVMRIVILAQFCSSHESRRTGLRNSLCHHQN
jgi:hypothetical protein